jgi:hypothetical protein
MANPDSLDDFLRYAHDHAARAQPT